MFVLRINFSRLKEKQINKNDEKTIGYPFLLMFFIFG